MGITLIHVLSLLITAYSSVSVVRQSLSTFLSNICIVIHQQEAIKNVILSSNDRTITEFWPSLRTTGGRKFNYELNHWDRDEDVCAKYNLF